MIKLIKRFIQYNKTVKENDPVRSCDVYKKLGCAHVDGWNCDMKTCPILEKHNDVELV